MVKEKPIAILIRGDLEINEIKLSHLLGTSNFRIPEIQELKKMGTVRGFVSPVGLKVSRFLVDESVSTVKNLITGANKLNVDSKNFNFSRDLKDGEVVDVATVKNGFVCKKCGGELKEERAIEFGHCFKYDHFYTKALDGTFIDKDGKEKLLWMGAFGIGIDRAMGLIVEANHNERGIIWPKSVSPYQTHLLVISETKDVRRKADKIYEDLQKNNIEVLYDDREDVSAGVKFADADLIGIPVRLVVSEKAGDKIEYKERNSQKTELLSLEQVIKKLR